VPELVTRALLPSGVKVTSVASAKQRFGSSRRSWSTRPSFHRTAIPLVMVQPWSSRVMGTRFLVRLRVAIAKSPLGCQATPIRRFASGTTHRSVTRRDGASRTVISDIEGVRNSTSRESAFVTSSRVPSGESATDHGFLLAASRSRSFPVRRSMTEIWSLEVSATKRVLPSRSVRSPWGSSPAGSRATSLREATSTTETSSSSRLLTYARVPSGAKATSFGWPPTWISATFFRVAASTTITLLEPSQATHTSRPSGRKARFTGVL
jgi:hypothetical protein